MAAGKAAKRLQKLINKSGGCTLRVAVHFGLPTGFMKNNPRTGGVSTGGPPNWTRKYEVAIDETQRDLATLECFQNGGIVGIVDDRLVMASRSFTGGAKEIVRDEPLAMCSIGFLDHRVQARGVETRYLRFDFPDGRWAFFCTGWEKRVSNEANELVQLFGNRARELHDLAAFRDAGSG